MDSGWSVAGYAGILSSRNTSEILTEADWESNAGIAAVAVSKELVDWRGRAALEAELHTVRRFAGQTLWEFGALLMVRWNDMPWDDVIGTSVAAGYGVSHGADPAPADPDFSRTLGVLVAEVEVGPPEPGPWSGFFRYQHRSSAFGVFGSGGQDDESTFFALGIRYRF